ncbi:MAG TPA: hypothetical protein VEI97_05470 [bacterium]|nr:hypothetical protein [bacterium]
MELHPLSLDRLDDFRSLTCFDPDGSCWCAINHYASIAMDEWDARCTGEGLENKAQILNCLARGFSPGYLAYDGGQPLAWCSVGAVAEFPILASRAQQLGDGGSRATAGIVCFSIRGDRRRTGVMRGLLREVIGRVRDAGFQALEGYPYAEAVLARPDGAHLNWVGYPSVFREAGFVDTGLQLENRRNWERPVMRLELR